MRLAIAEHAIGLPTGSRSVKPPGAVAWTATIALTVKPSKISTFIRWWETRGSDYAATSRGKQMQYIYPKAKALYRLYRKNVLRKAGHPQTNVVSASGRADLDCTVFRKPDVHPHIITTPGGRERLRAGGVDRLPSTEVRVLSDSAAPVAQSSILSDLRTTLGVSLLLHEGGPSLFSQFVSARLVDEFFLTLAPQIAGRKVRTAASRHGFGNRVLARNSSLASDPERETRRDHLYPRYASAAESRISSFTRRLRSR